MPLPGFSGSHTDQSTMAQSLDSALSGRGSGVRQYGALTIATGKSSAAASAAASEETSSASKWLWIGLACVGVAALWLIFRK